MNILVTGASGYIGSRLSSLLNEYGFSVYGLDKKNPNVSQDTFTCFTKDDINSLADEGSVIADTEVVIHLAGEARVKASPKSQWENNVANSERLYDLAIKNNVRQIILLSSIKADGNDNYGKSKYLSEESLISKCKSSGCKFTIIRSALVYGNGMNNGLSSWIDCYKTRIIPDVHLSNSEIEMIGLEDLCNILMTCVNNSRVMNKSYRVSDGVRYLIRDIDNKARRAYQQTRKYIRLPKSLLAILAKIGDFLEKIGLPIPFCSDRYNMLFTNKAVLNMDIYADTGIHPTENFLTAFNSIFVDSAS